MMEGYVLPGSMVGFDAGEVINTNTSDISLRIGKVVKFFLPADTGNYNGRFIEYSVETYRTDGNSGSAPILYPNCLLMNRFGGIADYERWTPRIEVDDSKGFNIGSSVLLLCVNGRSRTGIIVGGAPNVADAGREESFKDNHRYEWEFNGIKERVYNDGSYLWTRKGPTKADGTVSDDSGAGFSWLAKNDGNTFLGYNLTKDSDVATDFCSIKFSRPDKQLSLFAENDIYSETKDRFLVKTANGFHVNLTGGDKQAWLKATTYREKQNFQNQDLKLNLEVLFTVLTTASTTLQTVTTFHKIPMVGAMLGSVPLAVVATLIDQAAQAASRMKSAIETFEQSSAEYLSNQHDFSEVP
jgi:hypothetical protein